MAKKILSFVLLAFVAVALVAVIMRGQGDGRDSAGQPQPSTVLAVSPSPAPTAVAAPPAAATRLVAFYFHGTKRCTSCNSIENLTREALKAETDAAQVEIRSVNVDEASNAHYVADFELTMRTVVLAEETGGKVARWKRLDECWDRFGDPADFRSYVQRSLAVFREPAAATR